MNDKGKARRAAYEARQEKKGKLVVKCVFGALIALALIYLVWSTVMMA